jgi:hypothetical protein
MADHPKLPGKYVKLKCEQADGVRIDNPLFGLDTVERATKTGRIIFSEGVFDATTLIQLDESTIASCGSGFSREHRREILKMLRRLRKKNASLRIIIWFDHDPVSQTGQKSAIELGRFLLQNGITTQIVVLNGSVKIDINSLFLQSGEPAIRQALEVAKAYVDIRIEEIRDAGNNRELQHTMGKALIAELIQGCFPVSLVKTFFNGVLPLGVVSEMLRDANKDVAREKAAEDTRVVVPMPGSCCELRESARLLGEAYSDQEQFRNRVFDRGNAPTKIRLRSGRFELEIMKPEGARSDFERVARLVNRTVDKNGSIVDLPAICCQETAKAVLSAEPFLRRLPEINQVVNCPVPVLRPDGSLAIIAGYDEETGILAQGEIVTGIPLARAVSMIDDMLVDCYFQTPGDKSRAYAALLTPMLVFGGIMPGRPPVFMIEADDSQTGKGYFVKTIAAVYRDVPAIVSQRGGRGIGSLQESFDAVLIAGRPFISFDNLRGKLNEPGLESFLTELNYSARIPYRAPVLIDTTKTVVFMTSNGVELTKDQANRCCVIRIRKHPDGYVFRQFPEGDLLDHIRTNQPEYLGAVYSITKAYTEA